MITDELREWTRNHTVNCSDNRIALVAIADRIDEQHRRALERVAAMVDEPDGLEQQSIRYALIKISELDARVERIERKLNHKGVD